MLDGELAEDELASMNEHLKGCAECTSAREDYLFLRREMRAIAVDRKVAEPPSSFFRRRVLVPVPVLAGAAFAALLLAVLIGLWPSRSSEGPAVTAGRPPAKAAADSLARFDGGEKAVIFKEERK